MDTGVLIVVLAATLLAGVARGLTGFGFALVSVPFFLLVLDPQDAIVLSTFLGFAGALLMATALRQAIPWRSVWWLLLGSLAGMPFGLIVLLFAPQDALRIVVGMAVIVMAAAIALGLRLRSGGTMMEGAVGAVSGVLRTGTSISGPPVVLYLQSRQLPPDEFRATLAAFFLLGGAISIGAFVATEVVTRDTLALSAAAIPSLLAGIWLGDRTLRFVNARLFERLVLLLLVATALSAIGVSIQRVLS